MDATLIVNTIRKHVQLNKQEEDYFLSLLKTKKLKKKEFLMHENDVHVFTAFVTQGCLRSYSIDRNGFEHILQFAPSGWWISDLYSLLTQSPGKLNIDALEDTTMFLLYRTDQEMLFEKYPKFERFFRIITENSIAVNQYRLLDYMGLSAEQRYLSFCKHYPNLIQSLAQKHVAAYIGVTPEFLSKMKSDLLKNKTNNQ